MDTRVVTAHLPSQLAEKLDDLAERLERPKGWIVKEAVASYVALEEKRHRMTLEALADVDAGRALDHGEIEAWAAALAKPKRRRASAGSFTPARIADQPVGRVHLR
jgi:predicted transcriptional regulator